MYLWGYLQKRLAPESVGRHSVHLGALIEQKGRGRADSLSAEAEASISSCPHTLVFLDLKFRLRWELHHWFPWFSSLWSWTETYHWLSWFSCLQTANYTTSWSLEPLKPIPIIKLINYLFNSYWSISLENPNKCKTQVFKAQQSRIPVVETSKRTFPFNLPLSSHVISANPQRKVWEPRI